MVGIAKLDGKYGNPVGELHCVSDIPMQKYEGSRGLSSDRVGLWMTESEKYKVGFKPDLYSCVKCCT